MTIDIHTMIIGNLISKNLMKPWGINSKPNSIRGKLFNRYTGPGNPVQQQINLILIQGKSIKFMINHLQKTMNVQCIMI